MKSYYVESVIKEISDEIVNLINKGSITHEKKIVLYDLDDISFGMRTILANFGYPTESYITDDKLRLLQVKRVMKALTARYINSTRDLIGVHFTEDRLVPYDSDVVILIAAKNYEEIKSKLEALNYKEGENFYCVFDWRKDSYLEAMQGKRKVTLQEMQTLQKKMLAFVDDLCRKKNIRYWVCGGTLLGTIRHKGFIPWDDDADIFMPWKDYLKFTYEFKDSEVYDLIGPERSKREDYYFHYSKLVDKETITRADWWGYVRPVYPAGLDIFPLIGMPDNARERKMFFAEYKELNSKIIEDFYSLNGDMSVYTKWYAEQKALLGKYDFDVQNYVGVIGTKYGERDCTTRNVYQETIRMPFEDIEVNVPVGYKEYLDNLYGKGWMELPDESDRDAHNMTTYWLNKE